MGRLGRRGFTLIEMMTVVGIIGILAAIAGPAFLRYTYRAHTAELPANLNAVKTSALSFHAANNTFPAIAPSPALGNCTSGAPASPSPCAFAVFDADGSDTDFTGFSGLGWIPVGRMYGQYALAVGCPGGINFHCFTAEAKADLDGDGIAQVWEFAHPDSIGGFAIGTNFGGLVPPPDEGGAAQIGEVARDFSTGIY